MMIQYGIAKLPRELKELTSLFLFNDVLINNYLLKFFQDRVFGHILFSKNLATYLQEQRDSNDYFLVHKNLVWVSK
jgi:hypothetical protein